MIEKYSFGIDPIPYHAWNSDKRQLAITPNNQEIHVYGFDKSANDWSLNDVLKGHDLRVTGIDWAPKTNRIVTCSEDRNAYVWTLGPDGKWKPTQVLLRINRAATSVKWSPDEKKFAAGSGARIISVCYFEKANDWWVSKHIKKPIKSTITSIDWHPNSVILAAGSTDFKVKIFSGFVKEIETEFPPSVWSNKGICSLGTLLAEFNNSPNIGGWIHCVKFSEDGNKLCWVAHDSSISVAYVTNGTTCVAKLKTDCLPFLSCAWINDKAIVAAGHNCCPMMYALDGNNQLKFGGKLDRQEKKEGTGFTAMKKFQSLDRQAKEENDTLLPTIHQNSIKSLRTHTVTNDGSVTKFSTSGLDGQLIIWDVNHEDLQSALRGLKI